MKASLVFLTAFLVSVSAAEIKGRVADPSGGAVANARVSIVTPATAKEVASTTGPDGIYAFSDIAAGQYWLVVDAPGFVTSRTDLRVGSASATQDVKLSLQGLTQQVVVTASRRDELLLESATPTTLLDRNAIEDTASQTLEQLLIEQAGAGVYVSRGFGIGFPQINGIGGNRVLVLVDGQRQIGTDNGTRDGIDLDQFTTERLDRVEVVKGASSALYGSDAMGGVINLVTRTPTKPFTFDLTNNYGSFGETHVGATMGFRKNRLGGIVSGLYQDYDGYDLNDINPGTTGASGGENAYIDRQLSPTLFYDLRDNMKLRVNSNYYRRNAHFLDASGGFTQAQTQERWNVSPSLDWSLNARNVVTMRGDVSISRRFDLDRVERLTQFEALGSSILHPTNTLMYGTDFRQKWIRRQGLGSEDSLVTPLGPRGTRSIDVQSVWAQDEWQLFHGRLILGGGLRIENNSQFGTNASPKASAVFRLTNSQRLRFAFGRGFRAPDVGELYTSFSPGFFGFVGNPELTPETSTNYSAGWTYASRRYQASLDLFRSNFKNGIGFAQVNLQDPQADFLNDIIPLLSPGQQLYTNLNLGDFNSKGLNSALTVSLWQGLEATGNYTLLDRESTTGQPLLGLGNLRNSGFAKLGWRRQVRIADKPIGFRANIRAMMRGREAMSTTLASDVPADPTRIGQTQFVPAYQTVDFLVGASLPIRDDRASFEPFVTVYNLGNYIPRGMEYADGTTVVSLASNPTLPVFREPGRTWKAGFVLHFGK